MIEFLVKPAMPQELSVADSFRVVVEAKRQRIYAAPILHDQLNKRLPLPNRESRNALGSQRIDAPFDRQRSQPSRKPHHLQLMSVHPAASAIVNSRRRLNDGRARPHPPRLGVERLAHQVLHPGAHCAIVGRRGGVNVCELRGGEARLHDRALATGRAHADDTTPPHLVSLEVLTG